MRGVVRARAGDDVRVAADLVEHRLEQRELLVVGQRRRLAGRAGEHEAVGAVVDEVAGERARRGDVERAVVAERRDHRRDDATERRGSALSHAGIVRARVPFPPAADGQLNGT